MLNLQAVIVLKGACTGSTQSCIYAAAAYVDALRHGVARVWRIPLIRSHRYNLFGTYAGAVFLQILPICHSQVRLTNDFTSLCARARAGLWREGAVTVREGGLARWGTSQRCGRARRHKVSP